MTNSPKTCTKPFCDKPAVGKTRLCESHLKQAKEIFNPEQKGKE